MGISIDFQSIPSGIPQGPEHIDHLYSRSTETAQAFARRIEKIMETMGEARQRYSEDAEALVASASDADTRKAAQTLAKHQLANRVIAFQKTLVESSEPERADMLRMLKSWSDEADQLLELYASPVQFLGRMALGDTRRLNVQLTLAEAGPVELESAARQAIMTNDVPMAAAIVTVVDRRGKDRRPFSAGDFAARVVGVAHAEITGKLKAVQHAFRSAFAAEREFTRGKIDPLSNISLALARRGLPDAAPAQQQGA
jgi:hypothetical protein